MNTLNKIVISTLFLIAAPFANACEYPSKPAQMPDGKTATKEEMLVGVKHINAYQETMKAYLACIEADEALASQAAENEDEDAEKQRSQLFNKKYNAAVDEQTLVVEEFNLQIRAYKSRSN
ncbi:MAG: hypothetical protein K0U72_05705 [Gammaproteobacteria bacterium]|nr:hypothetical protein [Gammaproteobacteria bacterium]